MPQMTDQDREFFEAFGKRMAALRRKRGLTQLELAEKLGYSQQQILSFEKGRRRMYVSALPKLASALGVPLEELVSGSKKIERRGRPSQLAKQMERLSQLPKSKQRFVSEMLEGYLQQAS